MTVYKQCPNSRNNILSTDLIQLVFQEAADRQRASLAAAVPAAKPGPAPKPVPAAKPGPAPEPLPAAEPGPAPEPVPAAEPGPAPEPVPAAEPGPAPEPGPATAAASVDRDRVAVAAMSRHEATGNATLMVWPISFPGLPVHLCLRPNYVT